MKLKKDKRELFYCESTFMIDSEIMKRFFAENGVDIESYTVNTYKLPQGVYCNKFYLKKK